jgi:hypothetical protein
VLKAGSSWAGFRGNVDQLVIGVGSATTVFNFELQAPLVHLHTSIPASVAGTRLPADSDYTQGAVVHFNLSAAAGHDSLVVVLDDTLATDSGTVVMNGPHTIDADADSIVVPSPAVVDLASRLGSLLTASDMPAAYSDFLQWYLDRAKVVGSDSLRTQLEFASRLAIDAYRDAAALTAFDNAMAGTVTVVDHFGGADFTYYYSPEDYGGSATANSARSRQPVQLLRGRTGTHRVPPALLARRPARRPSTGPLQSAAEVEQPRWTDEPIAIIYVNGIHTPDVSSVPGQGSATATADLLRNVVYNMPGVLDANGDANYVEVTHFYNRNLAAQLAAYDSTHFCIAQNLRRGSFASALVAGVKYAKCKGLGYLKSVIENDISESIIEFVQNRFHWGAPLVVDVGNLAAFIQNYHFFGYHTILLTHSQGNMLTESAIERLPDLERRPLETRYCTAQLTMASPIASPTFRFDHNYLRGFDVNGDELLVIGFPNDFTKVDTDTSIAAAGDIANLMTANKSVAEIQAARLRWGSKIHGVDYNYFTYPASVNRVQTLLSELRDQCDAGTIQVAPDPVTILLGDSLKAAVTVVSRAGDVLLGRGFVGDGVRANLENDSVIVATAPTSGAELVPVLLSSTSAVLGYVSVSVPPVPFPATIRQYLMSTWIDTASHSQNDSTSGIPPRPPDPSWDGTPADCNKGTQTTAGTAWTLWAQQCSRLYVLQVPADPMPVRTKLGLQMANYPDGALIEGSANGVLLSPGIPFVDTLTSCGKDYCLTEAVVQSLNVNNVVMTSDTVCLSDRCGASQNRVRKPTTPLPAVRPKRPASDGTQSAASKPLRRPGSKLGWRSPPLPFYP